MNLPVWPAGFVASWLVSSVALAGSSDARKLIPEGNAYFESGKFAEAREVYANTPEPSEPALLADLLHNRAAAEFKLGNYGAARDIWVRAAGLLDAAFEAKASYNLGNCSYQEGLELLESSQAPAAPDAAGAAPPPPSVPTEQIISLLGKAIERYRDAIRLDPTLIDARANMELADQLRRKIKEQATSQPQSQQSSQPQSQPGSQPSEQQQDGQGDQSQSQPSTQPSSQPQSQPSEGDQQQENQEGQQDQQEPQSQPAESQPSSQPQEQPQPESQPTEEQQPSEGGEEKEMQMSPAEFERLLQKVRDAERLRRQKMREAERSRQRPVDKDW